MKLALTLTALLGTQAPGVWSYAPTDRETGRGQEVLAEINQARAYPANYADELRAYETRFSGTIVHDANDAVGHTSSEGVSAVREAEDFVAAQPSRPPLAWSASLSEAARDYVEEQGPTDMTGHVGPNGSTVAARLQRAGGRRALAEIISYGAASPAAVVKQFIVDDGVPNRGHRGIIFSDRYRFAGVACGPHRALRIMCVVDLATAVKDN